MLDKVKLALHITSDVFDDELLDLISAALADLGLAGVVTLDTDKALIVRAIITFCKLNFGTPSPQVYEKLKSSYDEQKAQLRSATGFTDWGDNDVG